MNQEQAMLYSIHMLAVCFTNLEFYQHNSLSQYVSIVDTLQKQFKIAYISMGNITDGHPLLLTMKLSSELETNLSAMIYRMYS